MQSLFFLILTSYAVIKLFFIGNHFPEEDFGGRFLLTEFPIFVLLYAFAIHRQRRHIRWLLGACSAVFVFWNLLIISETMKGLDWVYITGAPGIDSRINVFKHTLPALFYIKDLRLKLELCLPLILVLFGISLYVTKIFAGKVGPAFWYKRMQNGPLKVLSLFTIYLCIGYTVITLLNVRNNKNNVQRLKEDGFFEDAEIMDASEYEQEDFYVPMLELMQYYALKGRLDMVNNIRRYKDKYFTKRDTFGYYSNDAFKLYDVQGVAYRERDDYDIAIECYNKAIQLDPNDIDAYMNLGEIYFAISEYNKAIGYFKKIIQINPKFIHAYCMLGEIYASRQNFDEAIRFFEKAIQMHPSRTELYTRLGNIYLRQRNYNKAIFNLEKLIHLLPMEIWFYWPLGECYKEKGDYEKGIEYLQKAIKYYSDDPRVRLSLGTIYTTIGDKKNALQQVIKLKKLKRDDLADRLQQFVNERFGGDK
jgi:tetratricopeptide (TPR) repeat protein